MSATLDAKLFCNFFNGAPVINVPGRTFPVANYYLEDLLDATNHIIEEGSRYALRGDRDRQTASIEITSRGGEKRKEVHALNADGAHLADVSEDYPNHKMSTRRYVHVCIWFDDTISSKSHASGRPTQVNGPCQRRSYQL